MSQSKTINVVVLALIKKDDRYLFTLRSDGDSVLNGRWQIPGGGLEFGETVLDCLHREVAEELGTKISVIHPHPIIDSDVRDNWQGVFLTYLSKLQDGETITLNEEASEFKWFTLEELIKANPLRGCIEAVISAEKISVPSGTMFEPI